MSAAGATPAALATDLRDTAILVKYGEEVLGTAPVTSTLGNKPYDTIGTAAVSVTLPDDIPAGARRLTLVGETTGTEITVPIRIEGVDAVITGADVTMDYGTSASMPVTVTTDGGPVPMPVGGGSGQVG